jgi:hypothetical protein
MAPRCGPGPAGPELKAPLANLVRVLERQADPEAAEAVAERVELLHRLELQQQLEVATEHSTARSSLLSGEEP